MTLEWISKNHDAKTFVKHPKFSQFIFFNYHKYILEQKHICSIRLSVFGLGSDEVLLQSAACRTKRSGEWESVKVSARVNSFHSRIELDFVIYGSHLDGSFAVRGCDLTPSTLWGNQNLPLRPARFVPRAPYSLHHMVLLGWNVLTWDGFWWRIKNKSKSRSPWCCQRALLSWYVRGTVQEISGVFLNTTLGLAFRKERGPWIKAGQSEFLTTNSANCLQRVDSWCQSSRVPIAASTIEARCCFLLCLS